ncbi:MAG: hypothetical protein IKP55_07700 [Clostridia bacterium]|nr:hypothetical protein [Clostridia bacterium]
MVDVRRIALRLLEAWERDDTYLNLSLNSPATAEMTREERGFLTALLYGAVERRITLDYLIGRVAARSVLSPRTRNILRLGFYQLFFMRNLPAHAAVSLTVSLGESKGERGFLNGVLRSALRQFVSADGTVSLPFPPRERGLARHLSVAYSFPPDLVRFFLDLYGGAETEKLLAAFNRESPLTIAVNTLKTNREDLAARFAEAGIEARPTKYSPVGLTLPAAPPVTALPVLPRGCSSCRTRRRSFPLRSSLPRPVKPSSIPAPVPEANPLPPRSRWATGETSAPTTCTAANCP